MRSAIAKRPAHNPELREKLYDVFAKHLTPIPPPPAPPPPAPPAAPKTYGFVRWDGRLLPAYHDIPEKKPELPTVVWDGKRVPALGKAAREGWTFRGGECLPPKAR